MHELARQTLSTLDMRQVNSALVWLIAAAVIVSMALVATDIAQRDSHIRRVARHIWHAQDTQSVDNEVALQLSQQSSVLRPRTPVSYAPLATTALTYLLVFGDSSANGDGVLDRDTDAWYVAFGARFAPQAVTVRLAQSFARTGDLVRQLDRLVQLYPHGLSGHVVAVLQVGAEDVLDAVLTGRRFDVDAWSAQIAQFAVTLFANTTAFPPTAVASKRLYTLDYADASSSLGYISPAEMQCRVPLDSLLNAPSAPQSGEQLVRAFDVFSYALALRARDTYSAVPVRLALGARGFGRAVTQRQNATLAPPMFADCFFLNALGQRAVAELLAAHIEQRPFTRQ
jgi:lysophospholipase L1-like esterase